MADVLCSEQFGSGAARGCRAAPDGSLQWEAWGRSWWGFSGAFTAKPGGRDGGGGVAPGTATPPLSRLLAVFLPQGFPDSVSPDYLPYQLWDSVQVSLADWGRERHAAGPGETERHPSLPTYRLDTDPETSCDTSQATHPGDVADDSSQTSMHLRLLLTPLLFFSRPLLPASRAPWPPTQSCWA